jgi:hypothetical protein
VAAIVVAVVFAVPAMVVLKTAARAIPIAAEKLAAFVAGSDPSGAVIRRASPISGMPAITAGVGIPVSIDPDITGAGNYRPNPQHAWRWRGTYVNSQSNLTEEAGACGKYSN